MRKQLMTSQYEPLITPDSWQGAEKRYAIRLTQILDELHRRMTAMETKIKALEEQANAHD